MRLVFIACIFPFFVSSQINENKMYAYTKISGGKVDSALYTNFSIGCEYLVKPYLGLNYNFDFMYRNDNIFQLHSPVGPIAAPIMFIAQLTNFNIFNNGNNTLKAKLGIVLLALLIPDGVSFHIPYKYRYDFSPYVNILGFDYIKNNNTNLRNIRYAASFGFKTSYCFSNKLTALAFIETRKVSTMGWSLGAGFGIGYTFSPKGIENVDLLK